MLAGNRLVDVPRTRGGPPTVALVLVIAGTAVGWVPFLFALGAVGALAGAWIAVRALRQGTTQRARAWCALALVPVAAASVAVGAFLSVRTVDHVERYLNPPPHELVVTTNCPDDGDRATFEGTLTNLGDASSDFTVAVHLSSASGRTIDRRLLLRDVAPNETREWGVSETLLGKRLECRVDAVYGPRPLIGG